MSNGSPLHRRDRTSLNMAVVRRIGRRHEFAGKLIEATFCQGSALRQKRSLHESSSRDFELNVACTLSGSNLHHFAREELEPAGRPKKGGRANAVKRPTDAPKHLIPGDHIRTGQRFRERSFEIFRLKRLLQHRAISILWAHARRSVPGRKDERHVLLA